jgi:hypothetical protein
MWCRLSGLIEQNAIESAEEVYGALCGTFIFGPDALVPFILRISVCTGRAASQRILTRRELHILVHVCSRSAGVFGLGRLEEFAPAINLAN